MRTIHVKRLTRRLQGGAAHCCMTVAHDHTHESRFRALCEQISNRPPAQTPTPGPFAVLFLRGADRLWVFCLGVQNRNTVLIRIIQSRPLPCVIGPQATDLSDLTLYARW